MTNLKGCARVIALTLLALCAACGGGGSRGGDSGGSTPPPPPDTRIGSAGGTVTDASGANVVIPAGALTTATAIAVAQSSSGAPALPANVTAFGQIFAFTPHGTAFAVPVTITVPFDAASMPAGSTPTLYKTNAAMNGWDPVAGASVTGNTMTGQITGFSFAMVASPPAIDEAKLTEKSWDLSISSNAVTSILARNDEPPAVPQLGGAVGLNFVAGRSLAVIPADVSLDVPNLAAFSNQTGRTFWTLAVAPLTNASDPNPYNKASARLKQVFSYEATADHPTLQFHITAADVESIDGGGNAVGATVCPWFTANPSAAELALCTNLMSDAYILFELRGDSYVDQGTFYDVGGRLDLGGQHDAWGWTARRYQGKAVWSDGNFDVNLDVDGDAAIGELSGRHARIRLKKPITIDVPVQHFTKGARFTVTVTTTSQALNRIQGESFVGAFFRDPVTSDGVAMESTGLLLIPPLPDVPTGLPSLACAAGPDPAAGQLQFDAGTIATPEGATEALLTIERINGTHGQVSVRVQTSSGSAETVSDYEAVDRTVRFEDGEAGNVVVSVPLVNDDIAESDETLTATLSQPGGCASVGARASTTLTILDDDRPVPAAQTYTIGGVVNGLIGGGLVLRNVTNGSVVDISASSFTFAAAVADGSNYNVVVATQPTAPLQSCSMTRGAGTVAGANVTDIAVTCTSPPPSGSLDPTFGDGGRVASPVEFRANLIGARIGMALQGDGKILLVGGLKLLRFDADGTADAGFGTAGVVNVVLNNGALDTAMDVAVQADGKIVVVGTTSTVAVGSDDFALVRYNSDGTVDATFGAGGKVLTDFFASTDQARRVALQADGKIIVIGSATQVLSPSAATVEFAIARYNADGSPDTTFSSDGKTVDSPGGSYSVAKGVFIQSNGKIVVAGSTAASGAADPDTGFVRYVGTSGLQLPGDRDNTFGINGSGVMRASLGGSDEAVDVVTLDDGTILGAVRINQLGSVAFGIAHLPASGFPAPLVPQPVIAFTTQSDEPHCMLKQADGKIVVVGQSANLGANPDMAIVRFNDSGFGFDDSFGNGGKFTLDFFGGRDSAEVVVQQPDGKLVIGGYARSGGINVFAVTRLAQ